MSFDDLADLKPVADAALVYMKGIYGSNDVRISTEIDSTIPWRPTIQIRARHSIVVAEVTDIAYPTVILRAVSDLKLYRTPISAAIICPLETYSAQKNQVDINAAKRDGIGIFTVDESGFVVLQKPFSALVQHISEQEIRSEMARLELMPRLQRSFLSAHSTYSTSLVPGLQEASQIIEAMIRLIAKKLITPSPSPTQALGTIVDQLQNINGLPAANRTCFRDARAYVDKYRNLSSHPSRSAKEAKDRMMICRTGFLASVHLSKCLLDIMRQNGISCTIHI